VSPTEEELRRLIQSEIARHKWPDSEVQEVLLKVARDYVWRQGLWARVKFAVNVIGMLGILGGAVMACVSVLGLDVVRR
jgi:hypothetical protein